MRLFHPGILVHQKQKIGLVGRTREVLDPVYTAYRAFAYILHAVKSYERLAVLLPKYPIFFFFGFFFFFLSMQYQEIIAATGCFSKLRTGYTPATSLFFPGCASEYLLSWVFLKKGRWPLGHYHHTYFQNYENYAGVGIEQLQMSKSRGQSTTQLILWSHALLIL